MALAHYQYDLTLLSGSYDGSAILEIYNNNQWSTFQANHLHKNGVQTLVASPHFNDKYVQFLSGGGDGKIKLNQLTFGQNQI